MNGKIMKTDKYMFISTFFCKGIFAFVCVLILLSGNLWALAERPDFSKPVAEEIKDPYAPIEGSIAAPVDEEFDQPVKYVDKVEESEMTPDVKSDKTVNNAPVLQPSASIISTNKAGKLNQEQLEAVEKFDTYMKQKLFVKAYESLKKVPTNLWTQKQMKTAEMLKVFEIIDAEQSENMKQFGKDESLDEELQKTVKRLQREAKSLIVEGKNDLARDIIIQSLYLDRKNFVSKQLLERSLGLPLGSYKVENIEAKYWNDSQVYLYGGYSLKAVDALTVLAYFDAQNPLIFERMGSAYYMSGMPEEAIESWKRALYLNPNNKDLKNFISSAETELVRQKKSNKEFSNNKKTGSAVKKDDALYTTLRVVSDSNTAYSYAQSVRDQSPGIEVVVEELDTGKWAVKIPKPVQK
jgi:tetratricopeptide (TPR) repeat protein